jgi:hypothetical protein
LSRRISFAKLITQVGIGCPRTRRCGPAATASRPEDQALRWEMPDGGFKRSGYGKDLSMYGFEDYTRIKRVMSYIRN